MLLVHKPMPALSFAHRRLPSAPPTLAVRPTTTPGLLSISNKPHLNKQASSPKIPRKRTYQHQHQHQHQQRESSILPAALAPAVPPVAQSPSPERRGRKDTATQRKQQPSHRSTSQHAAIRSHHHQPSPTPLDKESFLTRNLDSDSEPSHTTSKSVPTLINQPSGRLARSRRKANKKDQDEATIPAVAAAASPVPIPRRRIPSTPTHHQPHQLSRSAPMSSVGIHRPLHRRSETVHEADALPLAEWDASPPSTPKRHREMGWQRTLLDNGPRTAPLTASSTRFVFPSATSTPPRHKRMPSYGDVFSFPFDEEHSGGESDNSVQLKSLLAAMQLGQTAPSQAQLDRLAYANSSFQNSPNPNDLPPPSFFAGAQA